MFAIPTGSSYNVLIYSALNPSWINMVHTVAAELNVDITAFREYCARARSAFQSDPKYAVFKRGLLSWIRAKVAGDLYDSLAGMAFAAVGIEKPRADLATSARACVGAELLPTDGLTIYPPSYARFSKEELMYKQLKKLMETIDRLDVEQLSLDTSKKRLSSLPEDAEERVVDAITRRVSMLEDSVMDLEDLRSSCIQQLGKYVKG